MSDEAIDLSDGGSTGGGEVPASTGGVVDLDRIIGNIPVVLVFLGDPQHPTGLEVLRSLGERLVDFGHDRVQVLAVSPLGQQELVDSDAVAVGNARVLSDPDGALAARFEGAYGEGVVVTVLVDAAGRVADRWYDQPDGTIADAVLERLSGLTSA
jgi:peroxiredoxin